jgi:hypothetical protein
MGDQPLEKFAFVRCYPGELNPETRALSGVVQSSNCLPHNPGHDAQRLPLWNLNGYLEALFQTQGLLAENKRSTSADIMCFPAYGTVGSLYLDRPL